MVLLEHLWDDVVAGPLPERGLKHLKKAYSKPMSVKGQPAPCFFFLDVERSGVVSAPSSPGTPSPTAARRESVWRSVFHPGSNLATKTIGADYFDRPQPNSPTVYDWLYSGETRSKHR
ncbi:hypothetical protein M569_07033 [Genlisea aurea]|uniref:Auxin-repressed protein n=1 Tax=Genlisea aurea TaxID=192259 RepID=S8E5T1_9LAMI|nr:hypothetical protein M569_07033 [Genlisea aurea]